MPIKETDIYGTTVEPVPGLPCVKEVAERLMQRANLVAGLAQLPGFRVLDARFRKLRADTLVAARSQTDEDLDAARARCAAFDAIADMPIALAAEAELALATVTALAGPSIGWPAIPRDFTEATAAAAIRDAEAVAEMAKHPGWALALREHAAKQRALAALMTATRGEARDAIRNLSLANDAAMGEILQILRLGADAEAWQMQHTPEATGEEQLNA